MGKTAGEMLKIAVRRTPEKYDGFGIPGWLHPITLIDQMVMEGQLAELGLKLDAAVSDKAVRELILKRAMAIGTVQVALHTTEDPASPLVFPDFSAAYHKLNTAEMSEKVVEAFNLYADSFELSDQEKKI